MWMYSFYEIILLIKIYKEYSRYMFDTLTEFERNDIMCPAAMV